VNHRVRKAVRIVLADPAVWLAIAIGLFWFVAMVLARRP
jgi:hypothetical protein